MRSFSLFTFIAVGVACLLYACSKKPVNTPGTHRVGVPFALNCTVSKTVDSLYGDDAAKLALGYVDSIHHPDTGIVEIDNELKTTLLGAIAAVYNSASAARDTVVNRYQVHAVCSRYELREILISGDTTAAWFQKLYDSNMVTGNAVLDKIFADYQFSFNDRYSYPWSKVVIVRAGRSINLDALFSKFKGVSGLRYAEKNVVCLGGGNTSIRIQNWTTASMDLIFGYGWGDCPSGCTAYRFWRFRVYPDCRAEFVESFGNAPAP